MENLSKNTILKTIFKTNEKMLETLNYIRKTQLNKEKYNLNMLENIIKNPMELSQICNNNNIHFNKINYIIWGVPKTGNISLYHSFKKINSNTLHFHSIIELLYLDLNFINYSEKEIIDFFSKNNPKIFVIVSYRNPFDLTISRIYHNISILKINTDTRSRNTIINKDEYINTVGIPNDYIYNKIFKEQFNIDFTYIKYNNELGFGLLDYSDKLSFVFTRLEDFPKFESNINKIISLPPNFNFKIECNNKNSNKEYVSSKNTFDSECIDYIINSNKILLNYYNYDIQAIQKKII